MGKLLTAASVARYQPASRRREIADLGAQGLRLVIQPSGARSWAMRFRRPNGRSAKLTLGPVDISGAEVATEPRIGAPLTLAGARRVSAEVQRLRAVGRDVVADFSEEKRDRTHRAAQRAAAAFGGAACEFVQEHARPRTRRWKETARLLGVEPTTLEPIPGGLAERWRDKPVEEIDSRQIQFVIDEVRKSGVPGLAGRTRQTDARARAMFSCLSVMFSWLAARHRVASNPCQAVVRPSPPASRDRVLTDSELRWFWAACDTLGQPFGPLFKLLLLTGARLDEVTKLSRSELSEDRRVWALSGSRTKNRRPHTVPLAPLALVILDDIKSIQSQAGFMFTTNGLTPVSGYSKAKKRLDRLMSDAARESRPDGEIPSWRLHDLRRTAATGMAEIGIAPHIVEAVLNHVSGSRAGVAGTYNRAQYASGKRTALNEWAEHVSRVVHHGGLADGAHEKPI
jgi:integrase